MRMLPARAARGAGLALLVAFLGAPSTSFADAFGTPDSIVVSFDPLNAEFSDDGADSICISVTIDAAATDVRGWSLVFEYDDAVVAFSGANPGSLMVNAGCPNFFTVLDASADSVWIDAATLGCSFAGPGEIAELCFVAFNCDSIGSPLSCRVDDDDVNTNEIRNGQNESVPYSVVDGTIRSYVNCPIAVESRSWGRTKARYRRP